MFKFKKRHINVSVNPAGKTSIDRHQNTTDAGPASDWSPPRPAYIVFWCWSLLVSPAGNTPVCSLTNRLERKNTEAAETHDPDRKPRTTWC